MTIEKGPAPTPEPPRENFARGLRRVDIKELGPAIRGKVRDSWVLNINGEEIRIMVTTDRQSAYDRDTNTVPGKGQVLNLASAREFERTKLIVPNHMIAVPHPNVLIAKQAQRLPVEFVYRRYFAQSSTTTSVYTNYFGDESRGIPARRNIYGIEFPEGLQANQEFPMGTISTPTTRGETTGHDEELTDKEARQLVNYRFGRGVYEKAKDIGFRLYEDGLAYHRERGLIMADTKYEFGLDENGELMLIDEVHTPDSSRFWLADTYEERVMAGKNPENFDKEILREWLANNGFTGEGQVPIVDPAIIDQMATAYRVPFEMITGEQLPDGSDANSESIREAVLRYLTEQYFTFRDGFKN